MILSYQKKLKGKSVGIVFGTFAPLHQGHLELIMRAKRQNDAGCLVIVCGYDGDRGELCGMPFSKRYRYVREYFANDSLIAVYGINDTEIGADLYPNGWDKWLEAFEDIYTTKAVDLTINQERKWYIGDKNYEIDLLERGETPVLIDRLQNYISATMIRQNPLKYWNKITLPFKRVFSKNILICGTASEGKSILTADLGKYFNAPYSTEYARDYMAESNINEWEAKGLDFIAFLDGQYRLNKSLINSASNNGLFFADSDSIVTRTYAEVYAQDEDCAITVAEMSTIFSLADDITAKCKWDKIYLIKPTPEYENDNRRLMNLSAIEEREKMFEILCRNLKNAGLWNKVYVLDFGYWGNFQFITEDIKELYLND